MKLLIGIFIFFFSLNSFAIENTVNHVDNEGVIDTLDSNYESGWFFWNEGLHRGTKFESTDDHGHKKIYDTRDDKHHFAFTGNVNLDVTNLTDIKGFDLTYGYHFAVDGSAEVILSMNRPMYSRVADLNSMEAPPVDTEEDLFTFGIGLGWRSDLIQYLIPWERLFDTFTFYVTYNSFDEQYFATKYTGPGFKVDYLMKYRWTKAFHFGLKIGYALAWTTRPEDFAGESRSDRRLNLGWMTLGLDIGLNF
jgi:hypothetical protein